MLSRGIRSVCGLRKLGSQMSWRAQALEGLPRALAVKSFQSSRAFSTEKTTSAEQTEAPKKESAVVKSDNYDEYEDDFEEDNSARGQVRKWTLVTLRLAFLAAGLACVGFTLKELFPGRMSPQSVFSQVFDRLQNHEEVMVMTGPNMKAYGRDVGRNEGRRNHVDSYEYNGPDGKRVRVRFNIKGDKGRVIVWAEVSQKMADNEYVYIICQNARTGRVVTIEDNRDRLEDELMGNKSDEGESFVNKYLKKIGVGSGSA